MLSSIFTDITVGIIVSIILVFAIVITIIFLFLHQNKKRKKRAFVNQKHEKIFEKQLNENGFKISKSASVLSSKLYIDDINKKWILKTGNKSFFRIYEYNKLLSYENNESGNNVYLHIYIDDPNHSTRSLRFESDDYSIEEKRKLIEDMSTHFQYILDNK